jgi:hypothetical protein
VFARYFCDDKRYHELPSGQMAIKDSLTDGLTDQQRLERLAKLCEELQAAVDQAHEHRRLLEEVKQTAQELLTDAESTPRTKRSQ